MICLGFGGIGCGKTTIFASIVQKNKKKKNKYYKRNSKKKLYKYLTEVVSQDESFYMNYKERASKEYKKATGKDWVEYAKYMPNGVERKDTKWYWRMLFNLFYPKNFYEVIYSTDPTIQDTIPIDYDNLGKWKPTPNCLLLLEEAGIGVSNRNYKNLSPESKELFALSRHKKTDIAAISQTSDVDKCLRQRCNFMFQVYKLGEFTLTRLINFKVGVDKETHDLRDMYTEQHWFIWLWQLLTCWLKKHRMALLPCIRSMIIYRPLYYKYFDSFNDEFIYSMPDPNPDSPEKLCYVPIDDNKEEKEEETE